MRWGNGKCKTANWFPGFGTHSCCTLWPITLRFIFWETRMCELNNPSAVVEISQSGLKRKTDCYLRFVISPKVVLVPSHGLYFDSAQWIICMAPLPAPHSFSITSLNVTTMHLWAGALLYWHQLCLLGSSVWNIASHTVTAACNTFTFTWACTTHTHSLCSCRRPTAYGSQALA